jgi:iron complex outermembrane receptor protein
MRRFVLLFLLSLLAFVYQSLAQPSTGQVQGRVIDATTGEGLPGVTVVLEGTPYGMATTLDGRFDLRNLPAGHYTLVASLLGYGRHTQALTLAGGTVDLALTLREEPITPRSLRLGVSYHF